jgi:predicted AAA+ superfamily ATPase
MEQIKKQLIDITKEGPTSIEKPNDEYQELFYQHLKEALNKFQELIKKANQNREKNPDKFVPNNLFINGRRGSGKTTILVSL